MVQSDVSNPHNEYWLEIGCGASRTIQCLWCQAKRSEKKTKFKSKWRNSKAGVPVVPGAVVRNWKRYRQGHWKDWVTVIAKPDNGVGAATFKIETWRCGPFQGWFVYTEYFFENLSLLAVYLWSGRSWRQHCLLPLHLTMLIRHSRFDALQDGQLLLCP